MNRQNTEDFFQASETILYAIKMVGTVVKTMEHTTPEVNPKVNYELRMCPCRFYNCHKCTPLVGVVMMDIDGVHSNVLSTPFCCDPETALKK